MRRTFTLILLSGLLAFGADAQTILKEQYGICTQLTWEDELDKTKKILTGVRDLGADWTRCDFVWSGCNPRPDVWDCQHLDQILSGAKKTGVNVLPILCYDVSWARPAVEHLYEWGEYVRHLVTSYGRQVRYWEVYNEPNLKNFWRRDPNGAEYAALLQKTYNVIKSIDPGIQVVFGGLSGVPLDYLEDALKAGAGEYFDVMNIHPYHLRDIPEAIIPQIQKLQALMTKYGVGNKPIWITEIGWSTPEAYNPFGDAIDAAYKYLGIEKGKYPLVCVRDRRYGEMRYVNHNPAFSGWFTGEMEINMDAISSVNPEQFPVMLPARGEKFPAEYIPALQEYLKKGGTILFNNGCPLVYDLQLQPDGTVKQVSVGRKYYNDLHFNLEHSWSNPLYPKQERWQSVADEFKGKIYTDFKDNGKSCIAAPIGHFLTEDRLKAGDSLVPIIRGGNDVLNSCVVGIYRLNSDLKGNIIICPAKAGEVGVTEDRQAAFLPRAYMLSFALGLDKVFWFDYYSTERVATEVKHHYNLVHKDFTPKPASAAFKTLVRMMPSGSSRPTVSRRSGMYVASWERSDGKKVWALWCELGQVKARISWEGDIEQAVDYLGSPLAIEQGDIKISEGCIYITGPVQLHLSR